MGYYKHSTLNSMHTDYLQLQIFLIIIKIILLLIKYEIKMICNGNKKVNCKQGNVKNKQKFYEQPLRFVRLYDALESTEIVTKNCS